MKTYRFRGHSRTDPAKYRPEGELDVWLQRDPIVLLGRHLGEDGAASELELAELRSEVQLDVDAAAELAAQSPFPTFEEIVDYVYAA